MKICSLSVACRYLGEMPGDECVRVWYAPSHHDFIVLPCDESEDKLPKDVDTFLFCAGQPEKFFMALHQTIFEHAMNLQDDVRWHMAEG